LLISFWISVETPPGVLACRVGADRVARRLIDAADTGLGSPAQKTVAI